MQESTKPADKTIVIYDSPDGGLRVVPGEAVLPKGTEVAWQNVSDSPVEVRFHGRTPDIFDPRTESLKLDPQVSSNPLLVTKDAELGAYPYTVFADKGRRAAPQFAEGGSHPRLIVIG